MSSDTPLLSELVLYGLMLLNGGAVALLFWRARRRGLLGEHDEAARIPFLDDPPPPSGCAP